MKKYLSVILIVFLSSCILGLNEEIDKEEAEKLINQQLTSFSSEQLAKYNAESIVVQEGDYLIIANSFNGDFNGFVYSLNKNPDFKKMKFGKFYITDYDKTEGYWTWVYEKW